MKKILNEIGFYLLLPLAGITYIVVDTFRHKKKTIQDLRYHKKVKTTYPVNPPNDFNEWINYISKQIK